MHCMQKPEEEVDCEKGKVPSFVHKYVPIEGPVCYLRPCLDWGFALITGIRLGEVKVLTPFQNKGFASLVQRLVPLQR